MRPSRSRVSRAANTSAPSWPLTLTSASAESHDSPAETPALGTMASMRPRIDVLRSTMRRPSRSASTVDARAQMGGVMLASSATRSVSARLASIARRKPMYWRARSWSLRCQNIHATKHIRSAIRYSRVDVNVIGAPLCRGRRGTPAARNDGQHGAK